MVDDFNSMTTAMPLHGMVRQFDDEPEPNQKGSSGKKPAFMSDPATGEQIWQYNPNSDYNKMNTRQDANGPH